MMKTSYPFKLVFYNFRYIMLSAAIFTLLLIPLSIMSEYLFLDPYVIWHISQDRMLGFSLIVAVSVMSAVVLSMNIFRVLSQGTKFKKIGSGFTGSFVGSIAGACSCGPVGFAVISTFGTAGGIATSFLTNYEVPLRVASLLILVAVYFTTTRSISSECSIDKSK